MSSEAQKYLLSISGPSGGGKTTLSRNLEATNIFRCVVSHTTRQKRLTELGGVDYHFVTDNDFNEISAEEWVERIEFHGRKYGLHVAELHAAWHTGKIPIVILDPEGLAQTMEYCRVKNIKFVSIYVDADITLLTSRYLERLNNGKNHDMAYHASRIAAIPVEKKEWREKYDHLCNKYMALGGVVNSYGPATQESVHQEIMKIFLVKKDNNPKSDIDWYRLQSSIVNWADATFPSRNDETVIRKLVYHEMPELTLALSYADRDRIRDEMADVSILFADLAARMGFDLLHEMHKKMEVNKARTWAMDNHGVSHHVNNEQGHSDVVRAV